MNKRLCSNKFLPKKGKVQGYSRDVHRPTGWVTREVYVKLTHTLPKVPKIIPRGCIT